MGNGVTVLTPILPPALSHDQSVAALSTLLTGYLHDKSQALIRWYYTPMTLEFSRHLCVACTVYDCMDELAAFDFAPPQLIELERELFRVADLVFTGGYSLYEAKRGSHDHVFPFPSSVDRDHFAKASLVDADPEDQRHIPHPRLGFYGVIDERLDLGLLGDVADARPDWSIVMVGPVVKIDP